MKRFLQILTLLCLLPMTGQAQTRTIQHRPYTDLRTLHFGILVGLHLQDIGLKNVGPQLVTYEDGLIEETWSNRGFWSEEASTSGHAINRTGSVSGDKTPEDVCAPYYMRHFYRSTSDIESVTPSQAPVRKIVREGRILIERQGVLYDLQGTRQ